AERHLLRRHHGGPPLAVDPLGFSTGWSCGGLCKSTRGVPALPALRSRPGGLSVIHDIASLQLAAKVKLRTPKRTGTGPVILGVPSRMALSRCLIFRNHLSDLYLQE